MRWRKKCGANMAGGLNGWLQSGLPWVRSIAETKAMNTKNEGLIKGGMMTAVAVAMLALAPHAVATPVQIGFNGAGGTGSISLTVGSDTTAGDPAGAQLIMNASGTFSDTNPGMSNVSITGVLARNFAIPGDVASGSWQPGDLPSPTSFSALAINAAPTAPVTFDDLFYPGGSPQTCWDDPNFGGFLDGYGVMLTFDGGFVDLWSDGAASPGGLTYGFAVISSDGQTHTVRDYQFGGVRAAVPEPNFLWLFGAALLGLFAWRRKLEKKA
ncbi:MAG: PEP-CTERM sorting domain-containing protein [Rhodanobacter sp.]